MENLVIGWSVRGKEESMWWVSERRAETVDGERAEGIIR